MKRYSRNFPMLSEEDFRIISNSKVCVVGCGGLGGYTIEMLVRLGIGSITAVDGDVFEETNLNRQILSNENNLGKSKAIAASQRISLINSEVTVTPVSEFLNESNAEKILSNHDLVVDALDKIPTRFILQETCRVLKIPFIHGAIAGWYGQVATIFPGDQTLDLTYRTKKSEGKEKEIGTPSFTPALISSIQVSEVVKVLIGKGALLRKKMLFVNTLNHEYEIIEF